MNSIAGVGASATRVRLALHISILALLTGVLYAPALKDLVERWWQDPNYSHGFLVPIFVGFLLWRNRDWMWVQAEPSALGLGAILAAVLFLIAGTLAAEAFLSRFSLVLMIWGIVLYLGGWRQLKALAFPLGFLLFMIPLPSIIYYQVTFPLQLISSRFATWTLQVASVPVLREGNLLILPNFTLEVVEACSGIRSLFALFTLTVAYGYLLEKRTWVRLVLVGFMIPIAIVSNGLRISIAGILASTLGPSAAQGFFHLFEGWVIFLFALILLFLAHAILRLISRKRVRTDA